MIKIDRSRKQPPGRFQAMAEEEIQYTLKFFDPKSTRLASVPFEFRAYLDSELREVLLDLFHGKCAFCETSLQASESISIEHFRPKQMAINLDGEVTSPGYWWLGADWSNLYPICSSCNRSKGNRFPVSGPRAVYEPAGTTLFKLPIHSAGLGKDTSSAPPVIDIATADEKNLLYALQADGTILIFDLANRRWLRNNRSLRRENEIFTCFTCDAKGESILAGTESGDVFSWQSSAPSGFSVSKISNRAVTALHINPDGSKAAIGFADGMVSVWDRNIEPREMMVSGHTGRVNSVAVTADGKQMISAGEDGTIKVWSLETTPSVLYVRYHDNPLAGVVLSEDDKKTMMLGKDGLLKVWENSTWTESYYFFNEAGKEGFQSLSASGDGRYAASLSGGRMRLFDLYLRREITPPVMLEKQARLVVIPKNARSVICLDNENEFEAFGLNNLAEEKALLLDPCQEDPEAVLIFQEDGLVVSIPAKDGPDQAALERTGPKLDRGQMTIDVFGLNRANLVRDRQALAATLKGEMEYRRKELYSGKDSERILAWLQDQFGDHQPFAGLRRQILGPLLEQLEVPEQLQGTLNVSPEIQHNINQSVAQQNVVQAQKGVQKERLEKRASFSVDSAGETESDKELFYLRSALVDEIHVVNYRPITELRFKFGPGKSELEQVGWKVLLGENAVGKSSMLEAVALALMGPKRFAEFLDAEGLDPSSLLRRGVKPKQGFVRIYFSGDPEPVEMKLTPKGVEYTDPNARLRSYVLGFGSARWLPGRGSQDPETDSFVRVRNLFNPFVPLTDAIKWLAKLQKKLTRKQYSKVEEVLARMLLKEPGTRFPEHKGAIYIVSPGSRVSSNCPRLNELSDGYQTILAIAAAIIQMLGERWKYEMRAAEGLVLLDEIGEHLHPTWKLRIVESLRSAFPRMQFLATTHEPLCLRGLYDNEILIMRKVEDHIVSYDDVPSPNTLSIDQLLTSPYFGMLNTFDKATEAEFKRYYAILTIPEPDRKPEEKTELEGLHQKLNADSLVGTTFREQLAIQAVDQLLVEKQKTSNTFKPAELKQETKELISQLWDEIGLGTES